MTALGSCRALIVCGDDQRSEVLVRWGNIIYNFCGCISNMDAARDYLRWVQVDLIVFDLSLPRSKDDFLAIKNMQKTIEKMTINKPQFADGQEAIIDTVPFGPNPSAVAVDDILTSMTKLAIAEIAKRTDAEGGLTLLKELRHILAGPNIGTPAIILMGQPGDLPNRNIKINPYDGYTRDVPLIFLDEFEQMKGVWKVTNFDWILEPFEIDEFRLRSQSLVRNR